MQRCYVAPNSNAAAYMAKQLIDRSKWFECTPLPDDQYEFVAKDEPGLPYSLVWGVVK